MFSLSLSRSLWSLASLLVAYSVLRMASVSLPRVGVCGSVGTLKLDSQSYQLPLVFLTLHLSQHLQRFWRYQKRSGDDRDILAAREVRFRTPVNPPICNEDDEETFGKFFSFVLDLETLDVFDKGTSCKK